MGTRNRKTPEKKELGIKTFIRIWDVEDIIGTVIVINLEHQGYG